jgi:hypothetical protein
MIIDTDKCLLVIGLRFERSLVEDRVGWLPIAVNGKGAEASLSEVHCGCHDSPTPCCQPNKHPRASNGFANIPWDHVKVKG